MIKSLEAVRRISAPCFVVLMFSVAAGCGTGQVDSTQKATRFNAGPVTRNSNQSADSALVQADDRDQQLQHVASTSVENEPGTRKPHQDRSFTSTLDPRPRGNEQSIQFLTWARERYAAYCRMELDANGNCVTLELDICWDTQDNELQKIAELKRIQSLSLYASSITDQGLSYLEDLPDLKSLRLFGAANITDVGINRLKHLKPELTIQLPHRKAKKTIAKSIDSASDADDVALKILLQTQQRAER